MDIICLGQQNWDTCWTGKQQLMSRLADRGNRVLYIDPSPWPTKKSPLVALQACFPIAAGLGLKNVQPNLKVFTYYSFPFAGKDFRRKHYGYAVKKIIEQLGLHRPVGICLTPFQRELFSQLPLFGRIYYAVDEWTGFGGISPEMQKQSRENEEYILSVSDISLAVSPRLFERFRKIQPRTYLLPNGVDIDQFGKDRIAAATPDPAVLVIPGPRIGYVGFIDDRLDYAMLNVLAKRHREWSFVFIGRIAEMIRKNSNFLTFQNQPNVYLVGQKDYRELPRYLAGIEICIAPYVDSPLTQSCNPLKLYEYLATGYPTIVTPLDGIAEDVRSAITLAAGIEQWEKAITEAISGHDRQQQVRLKTAIQNSWELRVDKIEDYLEEAMFISSTRTKNRWWKTGYDKKVLKAWGGVPPMDKRYKTFFDIVQAERKHSAVKPVVMACAKIAGIMFFTARYVSRRAQGHKPANIRRILVSRHGSLGDFILLLPTLKALRKKYPHAHIAIVTSENDRLIQQLSPLTSDTDEIIMLQEGNRRIMERLRQNLSLLRGGYDMLIMGDRSLVTPGALNSGSPYRIGLYDGYSLGDQYNKKVLLDPNRHESDNLLVLVETLGAEIDLEAKIPRLDFTRSFLEQAWKTECAELFPGNESSFIVIHPGSKRPSRRWPARRFAELIGRFLSSQHEIDVVITGVASEATIIEEIIAEIEQPLRHRVHNAADITNIKGFFALIGRAKAVVSNDTGTVHVVRAMSRPLLALLGPENDRRWGPYPLGSSQAITIRHIVPCSPCQRWECSGHFCMNNLSVDEAFNALQQILADTEQRVPHQEIVSIDRRRHHWSWFSLSSQGYEIPSVAAVFLFKDEGKESLEEKIKSIVLERNHCKYPKVEIHIICKEIESIQYNLPAGFSYTISEDQISGLEMAIRKLSADIIHFISSGTMNDIPEHVSTLYRYPSLLGIYKNQILDLRLLSDKKSCLFSGCSIYRSALQTVYGLPGVSNDSLIRKDYRN